MQFPRPRWILAAALFVSVPAARSADPAPNTPEQKVLDRWLGNWKAEYRFPKAEWTPEERRGTADFTYSRILGGQFVQEKAEHADKSSSMLLITYDAEKK